MRILGVNEHHPDGSYEAGNELITDGVDLPWLQETVDDSVWGDWGMRYRDVIILDGQNRYHGTYNLSDNDLRAPQNQAALLDLFRDAVATLP